MRARHSKPRPGRQRLVASAAALGVALAAAGVVQGPAGAATLPTTVTAAGPERISGGQVEGIPDLLVSGAVKELVPDPSDPDVLYAGTVNGGVWRTQNATAASPDWTPLTDGLPDLSIGGLALDPTVPTNKVLVAGIGNWSSNNGTGSALSGMLRTTNGGASWTRLGTTDLAGQRIAAVVARGATLLTAANGGVFRSTDTGGSFTRVSGASGSGLPSGQAFDLASDPTSATRLYAATSAGVFRSDDTGASWTSLGGTSFGTATTYINGSTNNMKASVHSAGGTDAVYVGVVNNGQLAGLLASTDRGASWTAMDIPQTIEGGTPIGLQPRVKPGSQGATHFALLAAQVDDSVVYLGGDRQPGGFPNSIGANDFTGRLFRCDRSLAAGSQCAPITHNGTANGSAPHADSRDMAWDANGDLVESDDGGVYRQTDPATSSGTWVSVNGDLQIAEHVACDWDAFGDVVICGDQDTGTPEQTATGSTSWRSVTTADGGVPAVDDHAGGGVSVRYSSTQNLGGTGPSQLFRRTCDAANSCSGRTTLAGNVTGGGTLAGDPTIQFYTPIAANAVGGGRLVIGTGRVYESTDRGDTLTVLSTSTGLVNGFAYGGRTGGVDAPGVLFVAAQNGLYLRPGPAGPLSRLTSYPGGTPVDVGLHPDNWLEAYVVDGNAVWRTDDGGASWTDVTGDLAAASPGTLRSVAVVPTSAATGVVVGANRGTYLTTSQDFGAWSRFAPDVPSTVVSSVRYEPEDDLLLVGTHGRGTFLVADASQSLPQADLRVTKTAAPNPVLAGDELFYTITVTNDGPATAYGTTVVDVLPVQLVHLDASVDCTRDLQQLTCGLGDLAVGESRTIRLKERVVSSAVADQADGTLRIDNVVTVSSASIDPDTSNNTATTPAFVQEAADLSVTKVCVPDGVIDAGDTATCTVYVDNDGPSDARDVVLTDTHDSDGAFTFGAITPSQGSCSVSGDTVTCALGVLAAASATQTGRAEVAIELRADEAMEIHDLAAVRAATPDPDGSDDSASDSVSFRAVSDLELTKSGPSSVAPGEQLTYVLQVRNDGPSTARAVLVDDVLPVGTSTVSVTGSDGGTCNGGVAGDAALPTRCSFGDVAPGQVRTMTVVVAVDPAATGTLVNNGRTSSDSFDDDQSDNLARVETALVPRADLLTTVAATPNPAVAGEALSYQVTVRNLGPSLSRNVSTQLPLPAGLAYDAGTVALDGSCGLLTSTSTVVCQQGDLLPGDVSVITVYTTVAPSVPHGTTLVATATTTSDTPDPGPSANSAQVSTGVRAVADLVMSLTSDLDVYKPSTIIHYALRVTNAGPSDAQAVQLKQVLPDAKTAIYNSNDGGCPVPAGGVFTCSLGTLRAGESRVVQLNLLIRGNKRTITQTATASSSTTDPTLGNNSSTRVVTVK